MGMRSNREDVLYRTTNTSWGVWSISEKTEGANTGGGEGAKFANPDVQVVPLGARGTIRRRVQTDLRQLLLYPVGGQRR